MAGWYLNRRYSNSTTHFALVGYQQVQKCHWHRVPEVRTMNFLSAILTLAAILCALLAIGFIALWLKGIKSILLPGLGLFLPSPLIILILLVVAVVTGILARLTK